MAISTVYITHKYNQTEMSGTVQMFEMGLGTVPVKMEDLLTIKKISLL